MKRELKSLMDAVFVIHSIAIHFRFSGFRPFPHFCLPSCVLSISPKSDPFSIHRLFIHSRKPSIFPPTPPRGPQNSISPASLYPSQTFSRARYLPPPHHSRRFSLHQETLMVRLAPLIEILEEATQSHWRANLDQLTISSL